MGPKISYLGIFGLLFWKIAVILGCYLYCQIAKFRTKIKSFEFKTLGNVRLKFKKTVIIFEIRTYDLLVRQNFISKKAKTKIWDQKYLTFWAGILQIYCHIGNQHSWVFQSTKFHYKMKNSLFWAENLVKLLGYKQKWKKINFWTKNVLLGCVLVYSFKKSVVIFEINLLEFVKHKFLVKAVKLRIGFAFCGILGPGQVPRYKVR